VEAKTVARGLAGNRLLIGAGLAAAPRLAAQSWIGPHSEDEGAKLMARAVGARDVGLALGTLSALPRKRQRRRWLEAAAIADGIDLLATLAAWRSLPGRALAFGLFMTVGSTLTDLWLIRELG
jgi:hypothetical protein